MTPTYQEDQQRAGEDAKVMAGAYAERPALESTPPASSATNEQAARSVMHPESCDPEWRYYHGAWGG